MPSRGDFNLDPNVLTSFSLDLTPELEPLRQWRNVVPIAPIAKADFKYQKYSQNWFTKEASTARPAGAEPRFVDYTLSSASGVAIEHALAKRITDEELRDSDDVLNPIEDAVAFLRFKMLLDMANSVATVYNAAGNFGGSSDLSVAGTQWSDFAASDPLTDVETAKNTIRGKFGLDPASLTLVMSPAVLSKVRIHPQVRNSFGGGFAGMINPSMAQLADAFGVGRVVTLNGVYNSANPGQTVSMADLFGSHAWLVETVEGGLLSRRQRAHTATFVVDDAEVPQDDDYISFDSVERNTSEGKLTSSRVIISRCTYVTKVLDSSLGYMIKNAVA